MFVYIPHINLLKHMLLKEKVLQIILKIKKLQQFKQKSDYSSS